MLFDPNTDWTTTDEYAGFDATMAETAVKAALFASHTCIWMSVFRPPVMHSV